VNLFVTNLTSTEKVGLEKLKKSGNSNIPEVGSDPEGRSRPARFCVFLSDPEQEPESNVFEKPDPDPESLFSFGSSRQGCGVGVEESEGFST